MDILGTLKNVATLSRRVDEALEIKQAVERLEKTAAELIEQIKGLEMVLARFKGGKHD